MPDHPEWYRAWRHDEREFKQHLDASPRLRRIEAAKRMIGSALLVAAMISMFLSIRDVVGW